MIIPLYLSSQDNFTPLVPPLLLARSIRTTNSFSRHNLSWTTSFYLSLSRRYPCFTIDILTHVSFNQERSNCLIYLVHFIIVHSTYRRILVSVRLLATYITIHFIHLSYNNRSILLARPLFRVTRLAARDNRAVSPLLLRTGEGYIRGTMEREESIITGPAPVPCRRVSCNGRRSITQLTEED